MSPRWESRPTWSSASTKRSARSTARGWPSCWWSRTPTTRWISPGGVTCSRPGAWCWPTRPPNSGTTPRYRGPTWERDMTILANVGPKGLYLLFIWLLSAAGAGWVAERKGYGERVGLTFGLILSVVGLVIVLLLPVRPGSKWRLEGWLPRRRRAPGSQ